MYYQTSETMPFERYEEKRTDLRRTSSYVILNFNFVARFEKISKFDLCKSTILPSS